MGRAKEIVMLGAVGVISKNMNGFEKALKKAGEATVVSHLDADGLCAAAIAVKTLERMNVDAAPLVVKQLDSDKIGRVLDNSSDMVLFTDLGSGQLRNLGKLLDQQRVGVIDHHHPADVRHENLLMHLNAHLLGWDGSREVSGAGMAYLWSRAVGGKKNKDLSALAVVGMVGDMQARTGVTGVNSLILNHEDTRKYVDIVKDVPFFGKQTRPVFKMLEYASDPYLPGLSFRPQNCMSFVSSSMKLKQGDKWRAWADLGEDERKMMVAKLAMHLVNNGHDNGVANKLVVDTYILLDENEGSETRDAMEFSTLLNACGRHDEWELGLKLAMGDRGKVLSRARTLLQEYRRQLAEGVRLVEQSGVDELESIQVFNSGGSIRSSLIGVVIGMALGSGVVNREKPVLAVSRDDDDERFLKISSRGLQSQVNRGLRLNRVMNLSEKVGGEGGGHDIAAGCRVPAERLEEFLKLADEEAGRQLAS